MRTDNQTITRLADYRPSDFLVDRIDLDIRLDPTVTRVTARLAIRPNPAGGPAATLRLDGDELVLLEARLDGEPIPADAVEARPDGLVLQAPPNRPFELTLRTELNPTANTKLMGLYRSGGVYCTQCEAEGFRRITYAIDRPDILSVYTTRIEADRDEAPVLLGNGNPVEAGEVPGTNRHYAIWHDPFPKPGYLFALVGGRLAKTARSFTTASGREVEIAVHVEPGKEERAAYALDALERSMRWDERVFGREYDLDVFNVVAVPDFNMGAMENKGLNIFNDKYVLASPETATDGDYAGIETVVAHEYFHNWTGNRITCRDWFQLCLKEGLTVFRDQEFSSDERSRAVHRIGEVRTLRARQFPEDAGPLAHPVRPAEYREINNFYTATVYEKGAELVRMLKLLLGADAFARGMERFFETCDGTAATVEDFLDAFATASGRDLAPFARWYGQAGTPTVVVESAWEEATGTIRLTFSQATPATPGQPDKLPLVIPVAYGLVVPGAAGQDREGLFVLDGSSGTLEVTGLTGRPVPSVFRGFSAPVRIKLDLDDGDLLALLRYDQDAFNRWQSAQAVALRLLTSAGPDPLRVEAFAGALGSFLDGEARQDPAFAALLLALPGESEIAQEIGRDVDPDAVHASREALRRDLGTRLAPTLRGIVGDFAPEAAYSPDAASAGRRALRNAALDLLAAGDPAAGEEMASRQCAAATNMTDRLAALGVLALIPGPAREAAFGDFAARYAEEALVLDKWFALQAMMPEDGALDRIRALTSHPAFSMTNPNRVRALIGTFALSNPTQFHRVDGDGYGFVADAVLALDRPNPQVAARLLTAFGSWRRMEVGRRGKAEAALMRIARMPDLSADVADIVGRSLQPA